MVKHRKTVQPYSRVMPEPPVEVPAAEAWLWQNAAAMQSVQQGLKDSAEGKLVDRVGLPGLRTGPCS